MMTRNALQFSQDDEVDHDTRHYLHQEMHGFCGALASAIGYEDERKCGHEA